MATSFWAHEAQQKGWHLRARWLTRTTGVFFCCGRVSDDGVVGATIQTTLKTCFRRIPIFLVLGSSHPHVSLALHVFTAWPHGWRRKLPLADDPTKTTQMPQFINTIPIVYHDNTKVNFTLQPNVDQPDYYIPSKIPLLMCSSPERFHVYCTPAAQKLKKNLKCTYINDVTRPLTKGLKLQTINQDEKYDDLVDTVDDKLIDDDDDESGENTDENTESKFIIRSSDSLRV